MANLGVIVFILILPLINLSSSFKMMETNDANYEISDRIYSVVDDLFISLKINQNFNKPKNVEEYMAMHNFIQDVLHQNYEKYKEMYYNIKTNISNKMTDQISGVNEVIVEMISDQVGSHNESFDKENNVSVKLQNFADLTNLVKNLNDKTIKPSSNEFSLWASNGSQEVEGRRIFAGSSTGIQRYPFMVSVHVAGRFVCAGSLLHERLAISAASCLMRTRDDPSLKVQIRIGSDYVTKEGSLVNIDRLFFHPEFDSSTLANNLVIVKSQKLLQFQKGKVVAIKYDKSDTGLGLIKKVKEIVILGWGRRDPSEKTEIEDRPLSRARINLYDLEECKYIYTREFVTEKNFCAGFVDRGEGACNHDGGGPALAGSLLAGVISFGSPRCGRIDAPTVFTRLGFYGDWIYRVMDSVEMEKGNLQSFHVPGSFEVGVPSEELDNMNLELENPKEVLIREFGLKNILNGPIDQPKNASIKPPIRLNEHLPMQKDILRSKFSKELKSDVDQIEFSEDSKELETSPSEEDESASLHANKTIKYADNTYNNISNAFTGFIKQLFNSGNKVDVPVKAYDFTTTSVQNMKSMNEIVTLKHGVENTSKVPTTKIFKLEFGTYNDKLNENSNLREVFEIQYEINIKPVNIRKTNRHGGQNKSVIIFNNGRNTQRFEVKNTNRLRNKLVKGIEDVIEDIDSKTIDV